VGCAGRAEFPAHLAHCLMGGALQFLADDG